MNHLEQEIKKYGISDMARKINVTRQTIYNWIAANQVNPRYATKVAEILDVPIDSLNPLFEQA